ncbi:asparagine synthetase domain-containing protein 1 [Panicum miliaceum]|uniref:Asparagine synthetase domain-containing protein 1 n=1 Tax=Panicum miliaceum TaxID=4540 RepID=A0A3L6T4C7_PANMI|nr:asparagine synthetase domain-containing protein 1 [Panicum miliaceum]
MCGISLVLSGDPLVVAPCAAAAAAEIRHSGEGKGVSADELKEAVRRRGPDSLGCVTRRLCSDGTVLGADGCDGGGEGKAGVGDGGVAELLFVGATLHLRGAEPVAQPLVSPSGSILVYNGEIYGGIEVADDENDTQALFSSLESCCSCDCHALRRDKTCSCASGGKSVPQILSTIRGPWALIYWQADATVNGFVSDPDISDCNKASYWEELPCGIYSIHMKNIRKNGTCVKEGWIVERKLTVPTIEKSSIDGGNHDLSQNFVSSGESEENNKNGVTKIDLLSDSSLCSANCITQSAHKVLVALRESVMLRTKMNTLFQGGLNKLRDKELAPIAVLFSGGLDSMILAALLDQCIDPTWTIDLLNVSFDGQLAPDRISAIAGLRELQRISPLRRWQLVEIDTALTDLKGESEHVMSLIHPSNTYMDLNIGIALLLAAGGDGWVEGSACLMQDGSRHKYRSRSRVLIVGSGADEQYAGYGRHRTKYSLGGWNALNEEMKLDVQRIWKRNMGRDDRCISDHGKEARFPFLDENVIKTLLDIPLWEIAKLDEPVGKGDKKILREVARLLGLKEAALQPKRAIQVHILTRYSGFGQQKYPTINKTPEETMDTRPARLFAEADVGAWVGLVGPVWAWPWGTKPA